MSITATMNLVGCGGGGTICNSCTYKKATVTVTADDLRGGTIQSATMKTSVKHTTCPYSGYNSPCTAKLDMNVGCTITGAGTFTFSRRPNGYSDSSSGNASVDLVVVLPNNGGTVVVPLPVSMGPPASTSQTAPCGSSTTPTIYD